MKKIPKLLLVAQLHNSRYVCFQPVSNFFVPDVTLLCQVRWLCQMKSLCPEILLCNIEQLYQIAFTNVIFLPDRIGRTVYCVRKSWSWGETKKIWHKKTFLKFWLRFVLMRVEKMVKLLPFGEDSFLMEGYQGGTETENWRSWRWAKWEGQLLRSKFIMNWPKNFMFWEGKWVWS